MIKNVMFIISFVTSSVCFIDLIRNKKQYRSLAYLILIVLIFTFIRPILVLFYNYNYYIRVAAIVFQMIIALGCCLIDYKNIYENGHRLYVEKWWKILICVLVTIVANIVGVACCYNPFKDANLIINGENFEYINARFVNALNSMTTDRSLYGFLKQNLLIVIIYAYYIISLLLIYISSIYFLKFLHKSDIKHLCISAALPVVSFFLSKMFYPILDITLYIFHEFNLPSPSI